MATDPISEYTYLGTQVTVFNNRMEIKQGRKKRMIIFQSISSLTQQPMKNQLIIRTNDRKKHKISLKPKETRLLKAQIESLL